MKMILVIRVYNYGRGDMPYLTRCSNRGNIRRFSHKGYDNNFCMDKFYDKDLESNRILMKDSDNLMSKDIVNYSNLDKEGIYNGDFKIDLKNISKYILNRNFIDSVNLNKFDREFYNFFIYFVSTKEIFNNKLNKKIVKNMNIILDRVGS